MNNLNATALISAGRSVSEPFQLGVARSDGGLVEVTIRKVLRLLPARRIVAVAEIDGLEVLVKIFVGRSAARYSRREVKGVTALKEASVETPALLWQGELPEGSGKVVVFEFINGASNLTEVWSDSRGVERLQLLQRVTTEVASMHNAGVVQHDIHPENFLLQGERILAIDGGDIRRRGAGPLNELMSLKNFGLFLAQFQTEIDSLVPELFSSYCGQRGWPMSARKLARLLAIVDKQRNIRKQDYVSKAFRECTRFTCCRRFNRFQVWERKHDSPALRQILADPDSAMKAGRILKSGNTSTVVQIDGPDGPLVIKRYNIKNWLHGLERIFRPSRAWASWANAFRLEFHGVETPPPVAMVEERIGPLRRRAYFITEYVEGQTGDTVTEIESQFEDVEGMAAIVRTLADAGLSHGDMKASNFLLTAKGAVILDLDSMQETSNPSLIEKDRERFLRNWDASPAFCARLEEMLTT